MGRARLLAVAAALLMLIPALGVATAIVLPPVPEQLIEGHTVFTVIEMRSRTQTNETRFAAAVAVLVREYEEVKRTQRFPGVLWFNDQYLVDPLQRTVDFEAFRYPCGGAVLAVNAGDPDPRMVIARINSTERFAVDAPDPVDDVTGDPFVTLPGSQITRGDDNETYADPPFHQPAPGTYEYENDHAWIDANVTNVTVNASDPADPTFEGGRFHSDTVTGVAARRRGSVGAEYEESYQITDPNDHSWVIDKYQFYSRDAFSLASLASVPPNVTRSEVYRYPVWVVNMLGSPVFVPDTGYAKRFDGEFVGANCLPYKDLLDETLAPLSAATCGRTSIPDTAPPYTDDPCMGYQEPSRNGFCYGGQNATDGCDRGSRPLRLYNALLYFKLEDLYVWNATRDHSDPFTSGDTNGCSEEIPYRGPPGGPGAANDWPCPDGDDAREGNSHPFHPTTPPHAHPAKCGSAFFGPNTANHGGSTYITPNDAAVGGWYQVTAPCDFQHATRSIDIYFSGAGRPFPPPTRSNDVSENDGSAAPFHDHHRAYP